MSKIIKTIAGMAVCTLGVLATSSCSKDEFFGLEDSVYLDNSLKTEIALSQEFADFTIACMNLVKEMNQPIDTAGMEKQRLEDGTLIYFKTGSQETIKVLKEKLQKAYPELMKADKLDFDEIQEIAFSENKALKGYHPRVKTKWNYNKQAYQWIYEDITHHDSYDEFYWDDGSGTWWFQGFERDDYAISHVIWYCGESSNNFFGLGGGIVFNDYSAASFLGYGEHWPSITNYHTSNAEVDFLFIPSSYISQMEFWQLGYNLGDAYYRSGRQHYIYSEEMDYIAYFSFY